MISLAFGYIATSCFSRAFITNFSVFNSDSYCSQKQPPEVFCNKGALRNFAKFTGKNLCQSLFFNKVAG